ncbi:hypothetical protein IPZ58_07655 [Streptomyces roseoverticillatus]|uniref:hypothetical protein n=1 Tax=Streptomyces roseoverticillatus TaxID=66429 RepID=UPI001F3B765B|nr:hypothetical protein [Streptomyces roseoverticillatus]MCF3101455.1 hypothetical protein [Streptomyces roseoverticillatus]
MPSDYEPDDEALRLYSRYKRAREAEAELKDPVREQAARDLKAGATVSDLARLTGLTAEYFRRIARAEGVERKRAPTVGKLAATPAPAPSRAAAPRWEGALSKSLTEQPPTDLGLSLAVAALTEDQVRLLAGQAEGQHPDWGREIRRELRGTDPRWIRYAIVETALQAGFVDLSHDE